MPVRMFLFETDGALRRLSHKAFDNLTHGGFMTHYAGQRLRLLTVHFRNTGGRRALRPSDVQGIDAGFLNFDERGNSQMNSALSAMEISEAGDAASAEAGLPTGFDGKPPAIPTITARRKHQVMLDRRRWEPAKEDLDRVGHLLFKQLPPGQSAFPAGTDLRFSQTRAALLRKVVYGKVSGSR